MHCFAGLGVSMLSNPVWFAKDAFLGQSADRSSRERRRFAAFFTGLEKTQLRCG
jgi:hypothetical protein